MINSTTTSCLSPTWASETLRILRRFEHKYAHRLPETELRTRALQKLERAHVTGEAHLASLVQKIVRQVLCDYGREQSRHYRRHVYDYAFDWPAPEHGLPSLLQDRMEELLADDSPLSAREQKLLQVALADPARFIRRNGQLAQTRLARHFGVDPSTINRWWGEIQRKVAAHRPPPSLSH